MNGGRRTALRLTPAEANKELARRWFHDGWQNGDVDAAYGVFAPDFALRGERVGPEGPRRAVRLIRAAFSPVEIEINLQLATETTVVSHYTAHGRHIGEYRGIPATGRRVTASGIQIWRIRDGKVAADWNIFDEWGLMLQITEGRP